MREDILVCSKSRRGSRYHRGSLCDLHNKQCDAAEWARDALAEIFSEEWPPIMRLLTGGMRLRKRDTRKTTRDMIIWPTTRNVTPVFRDALARSSDKIQEAPLLRKQHGG